MLFFSNIQASAQPFKPIVASVGHQALDCVMNAVFSRVNYNMSFRLPVNKITFRGLIYVLKKIMSLPTYLHMLAEVFQ